MKYQNLRFPLFLVSLLLFASCGKEGLNVFSLEDDRNLGLQVHNEILADPVNFPILDSAAYDDSYAYLYSMRDAILNSGQLDHRDDFAWHLYIIHDDSTMNAFCTPGGYIYIYSGLIKYLDNASSLAGVMGHEMAHADKRHATEAMTKQFGIETLISVVLGANPGQLVQITESLVLLKFSRANETEADDFSVRYLCPTHYHADGAANFFQKIIDEGASQPPAFLSTHPSPDNRVDNIRTSAGTLGCDAGISTHDDVNDYVAFKTSLP